MKEVDANWGALIQPLNSSWNCQIWKFLWRIFGVNVIYVTKGKWVRREEIREKGYLKIQILKLEEIQKMQS